MQQVTSSAGAWGHALFAQVAPEETFAARQWPTTLLLRPAPVLAVVVLLLNDHVFKVHAPSALTGKLSDFAGVFFFPLLLVTLFNLAMLLASTLWPGASRGATPRMRQVAVAVAATAVFFTWLQVGPSSTAHWEAFGRMLGVSWTNTADPTDLVALPVLGLAWWHARRCIRRLPPGRIRLLQTLPGKSRSERTAAAHAVVQDVIALGTDDAKVWWSQLLDDVVDGRDARILDERLAFVRAQLDASDVTQPTQR